MRYINRIFSLYLVSLLILAYSSNLFHCQYLINHNQFRLPITNLPATSQFGSNLSLNVFKPEFCIVEGNIGLNITAENAGKIHCALTEQSGERYFVKINQTIDVEGNNQSQFIIIRIIPLITTFPGKYHFTLNITGFFTYNENFEIVLGMGYSIFTIVLGFIASVIIIIIVKRRVAKNAMKKGETILTHSNITLQSVVSGKISCPACKKIIAEGLSFCPECGERIPEFLRYNVNK